MSDAAVDVSSSPWRSEQLCSSRAVTTTARRARRRRASKETTTKCGDCPTYGASDTTITASAGDRFVIALESNPSTGYQWTATSSDAGVVELVGDEYVRTRHHAHRCTGNGALLLRRGRRGSATLQLRYAALLPARRPRRTGADLHRHGHLTWRRPGVIGATTGCAAVHGVTSRPSTGRTTTTSGAGRSATTCRLYEKLCLEGFQSGLSWLTILRKRDAFRRAFAGFEPARGRPVRRTRRRPSAEGRVDRAPPRARSRRRSPTRARRSRCRKTAARWPRSSGRSSRPGAAAHPGRSPTSPRRRAESTGALEGAPALRVPLRRADHRVRGDAVARPRERPPRRLHRPSGVRRGACRLHRSEPTEHVTSDRFSAGDVTCSAGRSAHGVSAQQRPPHGWLPRRW